MAFRNRRRSSGITTFGPASGTSWNRLREFICANGQIRKSRLRFRLPALDSHMEDTPIGKDRVHEW